MAGTFCDEGTLTVCVGEGYISSHEASTLRKGDVIRTTRLASHPSLVLFNGTPLCPCEVVIRDECVGFRVIEREHEGRCAPEPGAPDEPMEVLPSTVSLGSIRMSLAELQEMASATLVSLGKSWSMEEDAELLVAGIPTARGKVVAVDEAMGMRVTEAADARFRAHSAHPSGYVLKAGSTAARVEDYDFREPHRFLSCIVKANSASMCDPQDAKSDVCASHGGGQRGLPPGIGRVFQALLVQCGPSMPPLLPPVSGWMARLGGDPRGVQRG